MKYVAALPSVGRVGHQFSQMFSARWIATTFGLRYLHADFVDGPNWNDKAAAWNQFFNFAKGSPYVEEVRNSTMSLRVSRPIPPRLELRRTTTFNDWRLIANGLPEEWTLYFADFGTCWYDTYNWDEALFQQTAKWFQRKAFDTPDYRDQVTDLRPGEKVSVVGYYRTGGTREHLDDRWVIPETQYLKTIKLLQSYFGKRTDKPVVYTQGPLSLFGSAWKDIEIVICDDDYPQVFQAMKTCIEADVFVGSTGSTNSLIRTLRNNRKISIGFESDVAASAYPDGPNAEASGWLDLDLQLTMSGLQ